MKTLYHFGDSFTKGNGYIGSFGYLIAKHYNIKYLDSGDGGLSNDQILQIILSSLHLFKYGDILLINFSYLSRFLTIDPNKNLTSTAIYFDDNSGNKTHLMDSFYDGRETLIDYFINYNYEYNIKLFKTFNCLLSSLDKKGIKTYSVPIRKDNLYMGKELIKSDQYSLDLPNELIFEPSYYEWLINKGWKNEEEGHYTKGIQGDLALEYIKRIDELNK
jgi:hypothetical protein